MKEFPLKKRQYYWAKIYCGLEHSLKGKLHYFGGYFNLNENIWLRNLLSHSTIWLRWSLKLSLLAKFPILLGDLDFCH